MVQLDDLDLSLLYQNQKRIQDKKTQLATNSAKTGLKIGEKKTKILRTNTTYRRVRRGGALGARAPSPPPGKKVPLRNVQKRRKSFPKIYRQKRMRTFRSDATKLKRKR